ncbi:hypothetical protein EBR21_02510 [bacterium]|nr:hypothetical protein [bacterium]
MPNFKTQAASELQNHTHPGSGLRPFLLLTCVWTAGCGVLDVYKPHEKRCKSMCNDDNSTSAKPTPFNFDLSYWNQTTPRSQLDPNTELVPLLRSNPFKLVANAMKTVSDDVAQAKSTIDSGSQSSQAACLKQVFTAPFSKASNRNAGSIDYGKCVEISKLEERLNSNRNTAKDGKIKVIELDSALQFVSQGNLSLKSGGDALLDANSGLELANVLPWRSVKASDLLDAAQTQIMKINLTRGSVQGTALEKVGSSNILKKSWGLLFVGLDERQPLQVEWNPQSSSVRLTGSIATLSAAFQRPTSQTQWDGFGYSREFIFTDFNLSGSNLELNETIGWGEQVTMQGSYFLRVNGDLVEAGGDQSKLFHLKALGKPCLLDVGLVTGFQGDVPQEQPLGQISICNATN